MQPSFLNKPKCLKYLDSSTIHKHGSCVYVKLHILCWVRAFLLSVDFRVRFRYLDFFNFYGLMWFELAHKPLRKPDVIDLLGLVTCTYKRSMYWLVYQPRSDRLPVRGCLAHWDQGTVVPTCCQKTFVSQYKRGTDTIAPRQCTPVYCNQYNRLYLATARVPSAVIYHSAKHVVHGKLKNEMPSECDKRI